MVIHRFHVYLVNLDPTVRSEIQKTRPCVVISPDEMNLRLCTIIIDPLTSTIRPYPFRVDCTFQRKRGQIALDQIRTVDKTRFIKRLGAIASAEKKCVVEVLTEMLAS